MHDCLGLKAGLWTTYEERLDHIVGMRDSKEGDLMVQVNPEHLRAIVERINKGPYFKLLGLVVEDIGPGYAQMKLDVQSCHMTPFGSIHGGTYAGMIDSATYWAVYASLEEESGWITLDLNVNMLANITSGELIVTGKQLRVGKTIALAEATIHDNRGRIYAQGYSKMLVTGGLKTIPDIIAYTGGGSLPPKYL